MPTVKIKYVGRKSDGERAFKADTDIEWFPGDVHDVDTKVAEQMLRHPDVFEQVSGDALKAAPPPTLKAVAADQDEVDDEAIAREAAAKKAKEAKEAADAQSAAEKAERESAEHKVVHEQHHEVKPAKKMPAPPKAKPGAAKKSASKKK